MIRRFLLGAVPILAGWATGAHGAVAVADGDRLWRDHVIPYVICEKVVTDDGSAATSGCEHGGKPLDSTEAVKVREAVDEWNAKFGSELRFAAVPYLHSMNRGVLFSRSGSDHICATDRIGRPRIATRTNVKLGPQCNRFAADQTPVGTIIHEMMHVAGFYHEHQRPDRDAYLKTRVPDGLFEVLFDVRGAQQWVRGSGHHAMRVLSPYDFQSIMHYPIRDPRKAVGSSRVDLQACKLEYSIVSPK